ncbi:MAG: hypothetical protein HZB10_03895 [Candidatus Yonathbacteria bacterium]|nr:hypothetical protein [Candidatus Yonathbacteria bacterium]
MNNFESMGAPTPSTKSVEQKVSGLEGACGECGGKGSTRSGLLSTRQCGKCHGKGFIKNEQEVVGKSYDWDKGVLH